MDWSSVKWIGVGLGGVLILFVVAFIMSILLSTDAGAGYCAEFTQSSSAGGSMTKVAHSSLYPYSGTWSSVEYNKSETECEALCTGSCVGFYRENENSVPVQQGTCYFYTDNNVANFVGAGVNVSPFFTSSELVVGAELPEIYTDAFIKTGVTWRMFRSRFDNSAVA